MSKPRKPKSKYKGTKVDLGKVKNKPDIKLFRGSFPGIDGGFQYATDPGYQGFPTYNINIEFVEKLLNAFAVKKLSHVSGYIWVEHSHTKIYRLIPLYTENGSEFDIQAWADELQGDN